MTTIISLPPKANELARVKWHKPVPTHNGDGVYTPTGRLLKNGRIEILNSTMRYTRYTASKRHMLRGARAALADHLTKLQLQLLRKLPGSIKP